MANPTLGQVHVNKPLSNLALHYKNEAFVADRVWPKVSVDKESDVYYTFGREEINTHQNNVGVSPFLRAPGDPSDEFDWEADTATYKCEEYALSKPLPQRVVKQSDAPVRILQTTTKKLTQALLLGYEIRVQTVAQNAALAGSTFAAGVVWSNVAGAATILRDINTAKNNVRLSCGIEPNCILMSAGVEQDIVSWLKINSNAWYDRYMQEYRIPGAFFGLNDVIVGKAVQNTANIAQAAVYAEVWNRNVAVFYREPTPTLEALTWGYTMVAQDMQVKTWWDDARASTFYEVNHIVDEELVCANAACVITNI